MRKKDPAFWTSQFSMGVKDPFQTPFAEGMLTRKYFGSGIELFETDTALEQVLKEIRG